MRRFLPVKLSTLLDDPMINISGVAQVASVSSVSLHAIKDGKQEPRANTLVAIADALGKPLDYFFGEAS